MPYMLRQRITSIGALEAVPTWRYKLPSVGKYTAFELIVDCNRLQARADPDVNYPIESQISKVELVEGGSRALTSLTGSQLDAVNYWQNGRTAARRTSQSAAGDNLIHLFLMGGRDLFDTSWGYDLSKMGETYIEYSHDLSADAAEKFDVSSHTVYLYGWKWEGPGEPTFDRFLRTRQLAAWSTVAADTIHTVNLPIGNPYRFVGFQSKTHNASLGGAASRVELSVNNGQYSPVTIQSCMHWVMQEAQEYHLNNIISGQDWVIGTASVDLPAYFSYGGDLQATARSAAGPLDLTVRPWTNPMTVTAITAGDNDITYLMSGYGFQKCLRIGFDHLPDGGDLLATSGFGSMDLLVTEAAADKSVAVFAQDVLSY